MVELQELIKRRAILKASLTRFSTYFQNNKSDPDKFTQIMLRKQALPNTFKEFENTQTSIELQKSEEADYRETFEDQYYSIVSAVTAYEKTFQGESLSSSSTSSIPTTTRFDTAKLPPIDLPIFEGSYLQWVNFKNTFDSMIHERNDLTDIQKFHYLRSSLKGDSIKLISHLSITSSNYETAYSLLESRFDNKRVIVQQHINTIINLPSVGKGSANSLRQLLDSLAANLSGLQNLGIPVDHWDAIIIQLIVPKLDYQSRKDWESSCKTTNVPTLQEFRNVMINHCLTLEALGELTHKVNSGQVNDKRKFGKTSTDKINSNSTQQRSSVNLVSEQTSKRCLFCDKTNHVLYQCNDFLYLSVSDRTKEVHKRNICANCLKMNHNVENCKGGSCRVCGSKQHNTILHTDADQIAAKAATHTSALNSRIIHSTNVLLSTAIVLIKDSSGNFQKCRALLDSGSQSNFITESAVKKLNLTSFKTNVTIRGISDSHSNTNKGVTVNLKSNIHNFQISFKSLVLPTITQNIPACPIMYDSSKIPEEIQLADPHFNVPGPIDLLLGSEIFWKVLIVGKRQLGPCHKLTAQNTHLGWILGGSLEYNPQCVDNSTNCTLSLQTLENQMTKFWELESINNKQILSQADAHCEQQFLRCHKRLTDGRFQLPLLFKHEKPTLGSSFEFALKRFGFLEQNLQRNSNLLLLYTDFMKEYIDLGHMELVSPNNVDPSSTTHFYLPHHAVMKADSTTTKLRVIFDGSVKTSNNLSLNDNLLSGPVLQNNLFDILINFRIHHIVLCSDIEKMYRQIRIQPEHRDFLRILWRDNPNKPLQVFRLKTVTYGTTCAPYQAIRYLIQLAIDNELKCPLAASVIKNSFYVDDLLHAVDDKDIALELRDQLIECLQSAGFNLRKWVSNDPDVLPNNERNITTLLNLDKEHNKTLGLF